MSDPAVAGSKGHNLGLADHGHGIKVESVERFPGRKARFGEMALDAPPGAVCDLVLGQGGKKAGRRPALLIGLLGDLALHQLDARQAQLAEQQFEARGVDGGGLFHAATSRASGCVTMASSS